MKDGIFIIGIGIIVISIMIYAVKNFNDIKNIINGMKKQKYFKIVYIVIITLMIFGMLFFIYNSIKEIFFNMDNYKWSKNNDKINEYNDKQIVNEYNFYKKAIDKYYENQNPQKPYIPEKFSYVEGEWDTGFVIQDENGNQYVWVPCTNKNEMMNEVEKLERKNFSTIPFISKDICINENCEEFFSSSLENGGFYISRFEIGKENDKFVSKQGAPILSNITKKEAIEVVEKMNTDMNVHYELINGYAYDTTLSWLKNTNDIKINKIENKENILTGRIAYNNIYDFVDNILEMTSETTYGNVIIRGFLFDDENQNDNETLSEWGYDLNSMVRISIREEDSYYTIDNVMGLRTILYK